MGSVRRAPHFPWWYPLSGKGFDKFAYVKSLRGAKMTPAQRCVLLQVWDYSSADGTNAYAGVQRIADDIGINERTVRRSLQWLCEAGWLQKDSTGGRSGDGTHWASVYSLTIPPQPDIGDTQPDIASSQPDIDDMSTGRQTLPPEPVLPEPVSTEPVSPNPATAAVDQGKPVPRCQADDCDSPTIGGRWCISHIDYWKKLQDEHSGAKPDLSIAAFAEQLLADAR